MRTGGTRNLPWPALVLAALIVASIVGRALAGLRVDGLWIAPDEMIYGGIGRNLWRHGSLTVFGERPAVFGVVYPALVGGPLVLAGLERGYEVLKVLQPLVMSLTAVPVYLWSRRLASPGWALVAAALTLAIPGLLYSGLLMSEVAFYPVVVLAAWAIASALERPTAARQALLVGAVLLAAATRLQALVLPLVLVLALVVYALLTRDARRPLRLWPSVAGLALLGVGWIAWRTLETGSVSGTLGAYSVTGGAGYTAQGVARFAAYHAADILLFTAVFPLCAVALLLVTGPGGRERPPPLAAYLATAVALVLALVVQVGAFASEYVGRLAERTLLPLAPVLFVGFAAWLARGAPRPTGRTAAVALAALGLILYLPLRDVVVPEAFPDAFTLVPLYWLREHSGEHTLELVVWGGAAAALALFALLPRRLLAVLPLLAAAALAFASFAATREVQQDVAFDQQNLLGGQRRWVDQTVKQPVAYVVAGAKEYNLVWQELFWNDRIRRVYVVAGTEVPSRFPLTRTVTLRRDGRLLQEDGRPIPERAVVAPLELAFRGSLLDSFAIHEYEKAGLGLWKLDGAPRLSSLKQGIRWDGDMYGPARVTAYGCWPGHLELTLLPKLATRVELRVNGRLYQTLRFHGEPFVQVAVPAPAHASVCRFDLVPNSLLGSTVIEFVRD